MQIPRFWAEAEGSDTDLDGNRRFRRAWGWSMSSTAEALAVAHRQVRLALDHVRVGPRGGYYPRTPLREPILEEVMVDDELVLVVTRNRYGAEILNTDRVLIADIDLSELERASGEGLLRRVFRRSTPPIDPLAEPPPVVERLGTVVDWAHKNASLGVIVYRTASGLRVFVTGVGDPATSSLGEVILTELGADPIYRELCRSHGTFRARLTPKPWRLPRLKAPTGHWPFPNDNAERRFQQWLARYEPARRDYAVCRRLATHGPAPSTVEAHIIRLHDERTRVDVALPLA